MLLVLPAVAKLEILSRFLHVFIEDSDVILLCHDSLDLDGVPYASPIALRVTVHHRASLTDGCRPRKTPPLRKKHLEAHLAFAKNTVPIIQHGGGNVIYCQQKKNNTG